MNSRQRKIIVATASVIVLMLLYPPYVVKPQKGVYGYGHSGYELVFEMDEKQDVRFGVLALQVVSVLISGAMGIWLSRGERSA